MQYLSTQLRQNWKSGVTVALVNIPLSISLAIAAGATPLMGVITAIWAGLFSALLGGSEYNIVGPTGALSGILTVFALQYGYEMLPMLALASGVVIFGVYLLKWHKYIVFIPSAVTHGFTLGVAFIIALNQLNFALGLTGLPAHESLIGNITESLRHLAESQWPAVTLFLGGLFLLFALLHISRKIPGPIIVALLGIGVGYASETGMLPFTIQTLFSKYGTFETALWQMPSFALPGFDNGFFKAVAAVSLVAILETLLSAKIADGMTKTKFHPRREVLGLAAANVAVGLTGGIPATAALARTALNIKSGATSRASAIINTLFVVLIALLLFPVFQYLPLATVASTLVYVAIRMVDVHHYRELFSIDRKMFWISIVVAIITVIEDPIIGILVGATAALLLFVGQLSRGQSEITLHKDKKMIARIPHSKLKPEHDSDVTVYRFAGELTYFNGSAHQEAIKKMKGCETLILSLRNLYYIDPDGLDMLKEIIDEHSPCQKVIITGVGELVEPLLQHTQWFKDMRREHHVFDSTTDALESLGFPSRRKEP